jgi:VWFA-related protein
MRNLLGATACAGIIAFLLAGTHGSAQQPAAAPPAQPPDGQAQQPPPQQQQPPPAPIFRAGVNFVRVDVIVTDKAGNFVTDLTQNDFEVTENNAPQKVETFKRIDLDGGLMPGPEGPARAIRSDTDEEIEASRDDVRLFGIFLDDYHVRRGASMVARDQIAKFVETQLGPSDMVGLMYPLTPLDAVRFTRNHGAIEGALSQFLGRKFEYDPKNEVERKYAYYPTETVEKIRNDVSLSAIKAMIIHMGGLKEGRKALILVSEGYSGMLPPQMRNQCAQCGNVGNPAAGNPMAGQGSITEDRAQWISSNNMDMDLRDVTDFANKNNVAIYAVDPRGLATSEFDIGDNIGGQTDRTYLNATMETLRSLALQSDGRAIVNRNDLVMGMKQIVRDTSGYYLLGYNSTIGGTDGKFHPIKVRVKRPGVQVRARPGYWAMTKEDAARAESIVNPKPGPPKAVESALAAINQPSRVRVIRTWIGTERAPDGRTNVTLVWEAVPRTAGVSTARSGDIPSRVNVTAAGSDGAPYFRGRVPSVAPTTSPGTAAGPSRVVFAAKPGQMQLRLAVEDVGQTVLDSEVRDVAIPDLTAAISLGTPAVFRARTARDFQALKADPDPVPLVGREFSRTDRLLLRVAAYGPGTSVPKVTARLLNRAGQPMNDLPVAAPAGSGERAEIEVALGPISAGEYLIEINASGEGGEAQQLVAFRVL